MTVHAEQVASVLTRALQQVLGRGLNDPRVRGLITVTKVDVSPDLAHATVHVSVLPAEHEELTMHGLRHAGRHVRTEVGKLILIRRMPRLTFKLDRTLKKQAAVFEAIERGKSSLGVEEASEETTS